MKHALFYFGLFFATQAAYCEVKVPTSKDGARALVIQMQAHITEAKNETAEASNELDQSLMALEATEQETAKVQRTIDSQKDTIAKLEEKLRRWLIFGRTVLAVIFCAAFLLAWRLTQGITKTAPTIWSWVLRVTICLAAGAAASGGIFYIITTLL